MSRLRLNLALTQDLPEKELVDAALLYLMTRYSQHPCAGLAQGVVHHLTVLLTHPELEGSSLIPVYENLLRDWRFIVAECRTMPAAHPTGAPTRH